jgi:hypothetical protein
MAIGSLTGDTAAAPETLTALDPWVQAELPVPPSTKCLGWVSAVGP